MKNAIFGTIPLLASIAGASPIAPRDNIDPTVLQFALTLEHLEDAFYKGALSKFSEQDFKQAGYDKDYYNNLKYIAHDEEQHVGLLSGALKTAGVTPVEACKYTFPYTDVKSFITLSSVLEGVGTSAYLGGAPLITSKEYLSVAGSILVAEALHTSLQRVAVGEVASANPYGTALDPTSVYTLAAAFIKSCPDSNAALPFKPFPELSVVAKTCPGKGHRSRDLSLKIGLPSLSRYGKQQQAKACPLPRASEKVEFSAAKAVPKGSYVTFVSGLSVVSVKAEIKGKIATAAIPAVAEGQTYVFITSKDVEGSLDDTAILFGPAILEVAPQPPTYDQKQQ
ncbi:hypothetical protein Q7P37_006181 [Cladosporium fusiforme]